MSIDDEIRHAIDEAVRSEGQPLALSQALVAWFEAIATGNESLEQRDAVRRRLELVLASITVEQAQDTE